MGGFSRCCAASGDGSHVPYIALSSTERHKEAKAVSRVCAVALQHQLKSACREEHTAVGGSGWIYQKVNAASATKLHPIEYDFVSVARSNTRSTYIMLTAVAACMSGKHGTIKRSAARSTISLINTEMPRLLYSRRQSFYYLMLSRVLS